MMIITINKFIYIILITVLWSCSLSFGYRNKENRKNNVIVPSKGFQELRADSDLYYGGADFIIQARDKRTIGTLLSGVADLFGYDVQRRPSVLAAQAGRQLPPTAAAPTAAAVTAAAAAAAPAAASGPTVTDGIRRSFNVGINLSNQRQQLGGVPAAAVPAAPIPTIAAPAAAAAATPASAQQPAAVQGERRAYSVGLNWQNVRQQLGNPAPAAVPAVATVPIAAPAPASPTPETTGERRSYAVGVDFSRSQQQLGLQQPTSAPTPTTVQTAAISTAPVPSLPLPPQSAPIPALIERFYYNNEPVERKVFIMPQESVPQEKNRIDNDDRPRGNSRSNDDRNQVSNEDRSNINQRPRNNNDCGNTSSQRESIPNDVDDLSGEVHPNDDEIEDDEDELLNEDIDEQDLDNREDSSNSNDHKIRSNKKISPRSSHHSSNGEHGVRIPHRRGSHRNGKANSINDSYSNIKEKPKKKQNTSRDYYTSSGGGDSIRYNRKYKSPDKHTKSSQYYDTEQSFSEPLVLFHRLRGKIEQDLHHERVRRSLLKMQSPEKDTVRSKRTLIAKPTKANKYLVKYYGKKFANDAISKQNEVQNRHLLHEPHYPVVKVKGPFKLSYAKEVGLIEADADDDDSDDIAIQQDIPEDLPEITEDLNLEDLPQITDIADDPYPEIIINEKKSNLIPESKASVPQPPKILETLKKFGSIPHKHNIKSVEEDYEVKSKQNKVLDLLRATDDYIDNDRRKWDSTKSVDIEKSAGEENIISSKLSSNPDNNNLPAEVLSKLREEISPTLDKNHLKETSEVPNESAEIENDDFYIKPHNLRAELKRIEEFVYAKNPGDRFKTHTPNKYKESAEYEGRPEEEEVREDGAANDDGEEEEEEETKESGVDTSQEDDNRSKNDNSIPQPAEPSSENELEQGKVENEDGGVENEDTGDEESEDDGEDAVEDDKDTEDGTDANAETEDEDGENSETREPIESKKNLNAVQKLIEEHFEVENIDKNTKVPISIKDSKEYIKIVEDIKKPKVFSQYSTTTGPRDVPLNQLREYFENKLENNLKRLDDNNDNSVEEDADNDENQKSDNKNADNQDTNENDNGSAEESDREEEEENTNEEDNDDDDEAGETENVEENQSINQKHYVKPNDNNQKPVVENKPNVDKVPASSEVKSELKYPHEGKPKEILKAFQKALGPQDSKAQAVVLQPSILHTDGLRPSGVKIFDVTQKVLTIPYDFEYSGSQKIPIKASISTTTTKTNSRRKRMADTSIKEPEWYYVPEQYDATFTYEIPEPDIPDLKQMEKKNYKEDDKLSPRASVHENESGRKKTYIRVKQMKNDLYG